LERLWAGWRAPSLSAATRERRGRGCVFCELAAASTKDEQIVRRVALAFVALNAYPYTSGHLMVVPLRHVETLAELTPAEANVIMELTRQATRALSSEYAPDGLNVGINLGRAAGAGVPGHLHVHVVPRWFADTSFLTSIAETRLLPEPIDATLKRVRAAWPDDGITT
jgi:ATP adenylyltransferase